ncbi:PQQ-binding-like beta-propeller repeat protein [Cellulomonas dongxiuzhuiae]|uniref:PQQ-binding-like beta-propeller repeat protein n=1 Tax=Cellulomonas dongxiuzhuiae TaxID=2819979 RepID=A0ABX8GKG6_9CELL|nr:PQQ-binding-like beta-propeller repeat protein [Cellulomonas dongxiuzhuiae]MBO3095152.1 PQQ-binding-like beta-propeller repeat protein [Cellulomonas dongxiuzhuiae]QWC16156.1 PQQ-binding-like beta-propeller repeat protein [Cellulomonas dongxiuzhuiae]
MAGARRVEVALEDGSPDGPVPPSPGRSTALGRRWWWLAVPVVAVLALVVGQAVTDYRERVALAALGDVRGVLVPLDDEVEVAWEVDEGTRLAGAARAGSVLVTSRETADHAVVLEGRDVATGARLWALDAVGPRARWTPEARPGPVPCAARPDHRGQVVCLVTDGGVDVLDGAWTTVPPTTARLLVLDADDGTVQFERETPATAQWLTPSGDDVLLVGTVDGTTHVRSQSVLYGTERWHVTVGAGADDRPFTPDAATSALLDARTLAVDHGTAVTLVSTDGEVLRTVGTQTETGLTGQGTPTTVELSTALAAAVIGGESSSAVVSATAEVRLDGSPLPVVVDDGSVPGLVLTRTPQLQAWDAGDGTPRWQATVFDAQNATILQGRVHVGTSAWLVTYDGATGAELWRWAGPTGVGTPLTDGRHLYVLGSRGGRHSGPYDLVALHVADGTEAWRTPLPARTWLSTLDGLLLMQTFDEATLVETYRVLR